MPASMKLSVVVLATTVIAMKAANVLNKNRAPKTLPAGADSRAPRKLSLFVRTQQISQEEMYGEKQAPIDAIFGTGAYTSGHLASTLIGGGLQQPSQNYAHPGVNQGSPDCHPKCWWTCGNADCDEVCDPVCAPPQCETACAPINLAGCRQRCDPPKCAIVCPTSHCAHGGCPGCKTICAPPKCNTECAEQCESKCSDPQCTWKCNPGKCEKPRCSLQCGGAKECGLDGNLNARPPPFGAGMTVLAKGLAAVDPKTLAAFAAKGPSPGASKMSSPGAKKASPKGKIR